MSFIIAILHISNDLTKTLFNLLFLYFNYKCPYTLSKSFLAPYFKPF